MPDETPVSGTIGILYPGELGSLLGRLLVQRGCTVVTTLEGRSPRTVRLCREAGLEVLPTLLDVAQRADLVLATVSPGAAVEVAERYADSRPSPPSPPVYVDLNSISPATATRVAAQLDRAGIAFVDGALHGLASLLPARGTIYLGGPQAGAVARRLGCAVAVKVLGDRVGKASAFKMMISGLAKGVTALFVEMSLAARQADLLEDLLTCYRNVYPGIMSLVDRMLPTYPQHAARRVEELTEVEQTMTALGLRPCLVRGACRLTADIAEAGLANTYPAEPVHDWSVLEVIEALHVHGTLHLPPSISPPHWGGGKTNESPHVPGVRG